MITLEEPIPSDVINNSENGKLRSEVNHALSSLASSGDHDNTQIIEKILKLRFEKAKLLKYENYAQVCFYYYFILFLRLLFFMKELLIIILSGKHEKQNGYSGRSRRTYEQALHCLL